MSTNVAIAWQLLQSSGPGTPRFIYRQHTRRIRNGRVEAGARFNATCGLVVDFDEMSALFGWGMIYDDDAIGKIMNTRGGQRQMFVGATTAAI